MFDLVTHPAINFMRLLVPLLKLPAAYVGEDLDVETGPLPASTAAPALSGELPTCPRVRALHWAGSEMLGETGEDMELEACSMPVSAREGWTVAAAWRLR